MFVRNKIILLSHGGADFLIKLEKGAIIIECPWRIGDTDGILLGETDIQSNQREWKSVSWGK
jgi:hypothetical protein